MIRWTLIIGAASLLGACANTPSLGQVGDFFASKESVEVVELARSSHCAADTAEPKLRLFPQLNSLKHWAEEQGVRFAYTKQAPSKGWLAVVEMGQRSTAGHALAVSRQAELQGAQLKLRATFLSPRAGQMSAQVITSPCVLVALPDADIREVLLLDQTGEVRARWHD